MFWTRLIQSTRYFQAKQISPCFAVTWLQLGYFETSLARRCFQLFPGTICRIGCCYVHALQTEREMQAAFKARTRDTLERTNPVQPILATRDISIKRKRLRRTLEWSFFSSMAAPGLSWDQWLCQSRTPFWYMNICFDQRWWSMAFSNRS